MAEGAAFIDQREAKAHPGPPLIRSDLILFHFPDPSLRVRSSCLLSSQGFLFSSPLASPGCSFEAMNSVSIKGLLKALLPRPSASLRPSSLPSFESRKYSGGPLGRREGEGGRREQRVFSQDLCIPHP